MINLNNVSLVCVATKDVLASLKALIYSSKKIKFFKILLITDQENLNKLGNIDSKVKVHIIKKFNSVKEWGKFIVFDLINYVESDYILLIHADGFVVNPSAWREEFLKYDFIGSPWAIPKFNWSHRDKNGNIIRVGNSVSIRSKKLLKAPKKFGLKWEDKFNYFHEDGFLCVDNRVFLEQKGIIFAPFETAIHFGREANLKENKNINPFIFHKWEGKNKNYPNFISIWDRLIRKFLKMTSLFKSKVD